MAGAYTQSDLVRLVVDAARHYRIDPEIAVAQIHQESGFQTCVRSSAGATGIAQFMPATAKRFGLTDRCDPAASLAAWGKYMRLLLDMFGGDYHKALAGYNAGEGNVQKYGGVPPFKQTQDYVKIILSASARSAARRMIADSQAGGTGIGGVIALVLVTSAIMGMNYYAGSFKAAHKIVG